MKDIEKWLLLHESEMIDDIESLVSIRSISCQGNEDMPYGSECKRALKQMLKLGQQYGFQTEDCEGHIGEICFGIASECIGIWGHLDVVPEGEGWKFPPYKVSKVEDFLIGRGVQDNKGPLISVLYAMRFLKESGWKPQKQFKLIFGCDEEVGMRDVAYYLKHRKAPNYSIVADCAFPVCRGEKGILCVELYKNVQKGKILYMKGGEKENIVPGYAIANLKSENGQQAYCIKVTGKSGHAAFPENTENAVYNLCQKILLENLEGEEKDWIDFLKKICSDGWGTGLGISCKDSESGHLTCNLGVIHMEKGKYQVKLDIRYPVTVELDTIIQKIDEFAKKNKFAYKISKTQKPYSIAADHPFVQKLMEVYAKFQKDQKESYIMGGGTYAKLLPNAVGFGPGLEQHLERIGFTGSQGTCHSQDEAQSLKNLKRATEIYVQTILKLDHM